MKSHEKRIRKFCLMLNHRGSHDEWQSLGFCYWLGSFVFLFTLPPHKLKSPYEGECVSFSSQSSAKSRGSTVKWLSAWALGGGQWFCLDFSPNSTMSI
jgi:hypothetical protein